MIQEERDPGINAPEKSRLERLASSIEEFTQGFLPQFPRPLESGPAEKAGTMGYLAHVSAHELLALFTIPALPDPEVLIDIIAHARSAAAEYAIILPPGHDIWIRTGTGKISAHLSELCRTLQNQFPSERYDPPSRSSDLFQNLTWYLADLRKGLNGWFYRKEGERSENGRILTVQILMNRIILYLISSVHAKAVDQGCRYSLHDALLSFASPVIVSDLKSFGAVLIDSGTCNEVIARFASEPSPLLSGIRLSWIGPDTWSQLLSIHLNSIERRERIHKYSLNRLRGDFSQPVTERVTGRLVIGAVYSEIERFFPGKIFDPCAGCGEMITMILKLIRMRSYLRKENDTILSRLISAGETIFATEPSAVRILAIRFVLVIWILGGQHRDQILKSDPLWYPIQNLTSNIRIGNPLFKEDFPREFISIQESNKITRLVHPVSLPLPGENSSRFSLVISSPTAAVHDHIPEVAVYLTRHYQSYRKGVPSACLFAEMTAELVEQGGRELVFLPAGWTGEAACAGFRRWLRRNLPATLIDEEEPEQGRDMFGFSPLILGSGDAGKLRVISVADNHVDTGFRVKEYGIQGGFLPENDGWRLDDPEETCLLNKIEADTMPLSGYLFDEIYPAASGPEDLCSLEGWTSLIISRDRIRTIHGAEPYNQASVIFPGDDPFLCGLFNSTLFSWYIQVTAEHDSGQGVILHHIRNLPVAPVDHYNRDECRIHDRIEQIVPRMRFLARRKETMHTWHDRQRVTNQLSAAQEELDNLVFMLYKLSPQEGDEIRRRVHHRHLSYNQIPSIDIF